MKQLHCLAFPYKVAYEKAYVIALHKFFTKRLRNSRKFGLLLFHNTVWAVANPPKFV